jgi:hypothetical protein
MALSANAHALLDRLHVSGNASNCGSLKKKLGLDDADFGAAQEELIESGLAALVSKSKMARTSVGGGDLSVEASMLLAALPPDGSTVGNYSLRGQLDLDDETYKKAKQELRAAGLIKVGVGYGGTVGRASATPAAAEEEERPTAGLVKLERELYEPFAEWLRSSLADQDLAFAEARITATPIRAIGTAADGGPARTSRRSRSSASTGSPRSQSKCPATKSSERSMRKGLRASTRPQHTEDGLTERALLWSTLETGTRCPDRYLTKCDVSASGSTPCEDALKGALMCAR